MADGLYFSQRARFVFISMHKFSNLIINLCACVPRTTWKELPALFLFFTQMAIFIVVDLHFDTVNEKRFYYTVCLCLGKINKFCISLF